ncbi:hypothetical protein ACQSSU_03785 [Micromonospora echinospora]
MARPIHAGAGKVRQPYARRPAVVRRAERILIEGAGGGFDVYAGLPLALALWGAGVTVHLANLSLAAR